MNNLFFCSLEFPTQLLFILLCSMHFGCPCSALLLDHLVDFLLVDLKGHLKLKYFI